jgi:uncharacterized protein involved in type VI secretion and phage assembly
MPQTMLAEIEVKVGGTPFGDEELARLLEVRLKDNLMLPDSFLLRVADPTFSWIDTKFFEIGKQVEISLGGPDARRTNPVFKGQITSLEPEFGSSGIVLVVRGYDQSHALNRTKHTETYQNVTSSDIAKKVAERAKLTPGQIDASGPSPPHAFVQQNNETDWEFLWRLARKHDFEVVVHDKTLDFRKAGGPRGYTTRKLRWGEELLAFRPRVTGVQQVKEVRVRGWDPGSRDVIEASADVEQLGSEIGIKRDEVVDGLGGGTMIVPDAPVASAGEAQELAKSIASQFAQSYLEAEGVCLGDARILAGTKLEIEGVGKQFSGTYECSSTTHVFRGGRGYETHFAVTGRTSRTLIDLMTPAKKNGWASSVVIGVVTQNDDPEKLGRVRVKYPPLAEDAEGWWARIASPAAGQDRGLLMMPLVGDEVLVCFEHGDARRPYVIGALWNAKATPGDLVQTDGSFALQTDKKVLVTSQDAISIKAKDDIKIESDKTISQKATQNGDLVLEASGGKVTLKAATSVTVEGGTEVTIKVPGGSISLKSGGIVQVSGTQIMLG